MDATNEGRAVPDLVTFTEIANRVNRAQITPRPLTRQGVRHIAENDPEWPIPREQWIKAGNAWLMPWPPVEKFFRERKTRGRGPNRRPDDGAAE